MRKFVRVGFNALGVVLLIALVVYIAVQLWIVAIHWAGKQ